MKESIIEFELKNETKTEKETAEGTDIIYKYLFKADNDTLCKLTLITETKIGLSIGDVIGVPFKNMQKRLGK